MAMALPVAYGAPLNHLAEGGWGTVVAQRTAKPPCNVDATSSYSAPKALLTASLASLHLVRTVRVRRQAQGALAPQRSVPLDDGRRWEASVSRLGPPLKGKPRNLAESWNTGAGRLRVACHEAGSITSVALQGKNLCFGTSSGRVRVVDLQSGAKVGEYFAASHLPSPINFLHFSDSMVIAGDLAGGLRAWKPEFPGAEGYTPRPYLTFQEKPGFLCAHTSALIGLEVSDERMISCSSDGTLSFWSFADAKEGVVHPSFSTSLEGVPLCLSGTERVVFVGLKDGSVRKIERKKTKCIDSMVLAPSDAGAVTALAFQSGTLIVGFEDGQVKFLRKGAKKAEVAGAFHSSHVQDLKMISQDRFVTSSTDGRLGIWSFTEGSPLWGFHGLRGPEDPFQDDAEEVRQSFRNISFAADDQRLVFTGLVINPVTPANTVFINNWRNRRSPYDEVAPACEAVLCMDFDAKGR